MSKLHQIATVALWALLGLSVAVASAQRSNRNKSDGPRMEISPAEHDFGDVQQNQKLVFAFTVTNTGTEELEIRRLSTSCGCTAAVTQERTVPPGGSTKLEVTLETRKYRGFIERSVSVASNDPSRVQQVRVQAFVESDE